MLQLELLQEGIVPEIWIEDIWVISQRILNPRLLWTQGTGRSWHYLLTKNKEQNSVILREGLAKITPEALYFQDDAYSILQLLKAFR